MGQYLSGNSDVQQQAERVLLEFFSEEVGVPLMKRRLHAESGCYIEVDGCSEDEDILVEVFAHQGPARSGQNQKLLADAYKLLFAEQLLGHPARKVLLLSDQKAAARFLGKGWPAESLRRFGIELQFVTLPEEITQSLVEAQKRQRR